MHDGDPSNDEMPLRLGTVLIWPLMAMAALITFVVLVVGSVWLLFQDFAYPESVLVKGMIFAFATVVAVTAWRRLRR